jgi:aspartate racemase
MIEVTLDEVWRRGWKRVGVMGLGDPFVYTRRLDSLGIACEILEPPRRAPLDGAIFRLMEGRDDDEERRVAREAVEQLRGRHVEGIILGCTELPLLLREHAEAADLLNPAQLLAEAAVRHALE